MDIHTNQHSSEELAKQAHHLANKVWNEISPQLEELLGEDDFNRWFSDTIPLSLKNNELILQTNGRFSTLWISHNYLSKVNILLNLYQANLKAKFVSPQEPLESDNKPMIH